MSRTTSIDHAKHNEQACNYLSSKEKFGDWIITTAFYASLHYVRHLMIPTIASDGTTYNCFEHLYADTNCSETKHAFVKNYVRNNHRSIAIQYKTLFDLCHSARYVEYNIPRNTSKQSKDLLAEIKNYVLINKPA